MHRERNTEIAKATLQFDGPLFIVGMPRSGTKLLREILNAHPHVSILRYETEFLPYWTVNWNKFGDLSDRTQFQKFYKSCQRLPFFTYLRDTGHAINVNEWYDRCDGFSPAAVFDGMAHVHLELPKGTQTIWGDKSPSYLCHIRLLRELYPSSKFIHIVRDVRDYCLSINKAWGKNMLRAAQRWSDDVSLAKSVGKTLSKSYLEIRYEDLLANPSIVVNAICEFLSISFDRSIMELSEPTENIGDARGVRQIVKTNVGKYLTEIDTHMISKIESIAGETLNSAGYSCDYMGPPKSLGRTRLKYYQFIDGINLLRSFSKERGIKGGLSFAYHYFTKSGNRLDSDG